MTPPEPLRRFPRSRLRRRGAAGIGRLRGRPCLGPAVRVHHEPLTIPFMQQPSSITADIPLSPFAGEAPDMFFGLPMAMARAMALRGERIGHDMAQVRMGFQADQANSRGEVHGGSIATLLDCTLAAAARGVGRSQRCQTSISGTMRRSMPGISLSAMAPNTAWVTGK